MRVLVMRSAGGPLDMHPLELEERPTPRATGPFDVVVRVAAAGVCRTDLHLITGQMPATVPLVLGHENAGFVHEIGPAVTSVKVGDPVLCFPFITSGLSEGERAGLDTSAPDRRTPGITVDGGYAEFMLTNERAMLRVPADADLTALATLTDAGLAAYRASKRASASTRPGDTVVVFGVGGLGHLGIQILRALSATRIVAIDPEPRARELARDCGADVVLEPTRASREEVGAVRAVIDFVGSDATAQAALELLEFGGSYYAVGVGGTLQLPLADLVEREISIEGVFVGTYTDLVEVTELCTSGRVKPRVTTYGLDEANRALADLASGRVLGRAVLVP